MRHGKKVNHLGRKKGHRKAMLKKHVQFFNSAQANKHNRC